MPDNERKIMDNCQLRWSARKHLEGNWGMAILLCLMFSIVGAISRFIPFIGYIACILISGSLTLGLSSCFIHLVRDEEFRFEDLFDGFNHFGSALALFLLIWLFTLLWTILIIIPGIIATYRYSMAYYILNDNPGMDALDAIRESKRMMKGYKWKLFCLHLSFIGWGILCIFTFCIGYLWLIPYIKTSEAEFYNNLKAAMQTEPPVEENSVYSEIGPEM